MSEYRLEIRVRPGAKRSQVCGQMQGKLLVWVTNPPVDGAATEAALLAVAQAFDRPRRDIRLLRGATTRDKLVAISGDLLELSARADYLRELA